MWVKQVMGNLLHPQILKTKPDVLITDIKMPFMDGIELSKLVKEKLPDIRIVIVSGYDEFEYAREAILLGEKMLYCSIEA